MPASSGAAGGEVLFSGSVQLNLTADNGAKLWSGDQNPMLDNTQVQVRRSTTRLTTQNVGSTRKKQHTVDFEYQVTFTGNMVGAGFANVATVIDGKLAEGNRPPRLTATIIVPATNVNDSLTVPGFTRTFKGGDLDTFDMTIPTAGALTNGITVIFDEMD